MGRITGLRPRNGREKRISIYLDGRFAFTLSAAAAARERIEVGQELGSARAEALVKADSLERCLAAAAGYLGYRPRSESELRDKLHRRGFSGAEIEIVIGRLKGEGLVDDAAFARFWTDNRESFRPRSRRLTRLELKRKGLDDEVIAQATSGIDDAENAYRAALSRGRSLPLDEFEVFRRRLGAHLVRRGFEPSVIRCAVKRAWEELGGRSQAAFPEL